MKILIVGDCVSLHCGFIEAHGKVWYHYISDKHTVTNLSYGGYSNQKIFVETVKEINKNSYDLIIVQWASPYRINLSKNGFYDDLLILNINSPVEEPFDHFYNTWMKHLLNSKAELTDLITYATALGVYLKAKKQKYIFIKGADTFLDDLQQDDWRSCRKDFLDKVLFQSQHPDFEISQVFSDLKKQYQILIETCGKYWLNLQGPGWREQIIDEADEVKYYIDDQGQSHNCCPYPGIKSNQQQFVDLQKFAETLGFNL